MIKLTARFAPEGKDPYTKPIYVDPAAISVIGENEKGDTWLPLIGIVVLEPPEKVRKMVEEMGRQAQHDQMITKMDEVLNKLDDESI